MSESSLVKMPHCLKSRVAAHICETIENMSRLFETNWASMDASKPVFVGFANNKGADQSAHPRRLISAFVFDFRKLSHQNLLHVKFQYI